MTMTYRPSLYGSTNKLAALPWDFYMTTALLNDVNLTVINVLVEQFGKLKQDTSSIPNNGSHTNPLLYTFLLRYTDDEHL